MRKATITATGLILSLAVPALAQNNLNPRNDPDVQRGIERQRESIERERAADRQRSQDGQPHTERQYRDQQFGGNPNYQVEKSHQTKGQ
jgi:hypothetical protein